MQGTQNTIAEREEGTSLPVETTGWICSPLDMSCPEKLQMWLPQAEWHQAGLTPPGGTRLKHEEHADLPLPATPPLQKDLWK